MEKERLLETNDGADRVSGLYASSPFAAPFVSESGIITMIRLRCCHDG
jgi:hypothetical protein